MSTVKFVRRSWAVLVLALLAVSCSHKTPGPGPLDARTSATAASRTGGGATAGSAAPLPPTIPAVREWAPRDGSFALGANPKVVAPPSLRAEAEVFAEDLGTILGNKPAVVTTGASGGDLELRQREPDAQLGKEGYEITTAGHVVVAAPETAGVFFGTRTVLQWIKQSHALPAGSGGTTLPGGTVRDWPSWPERAFMVDTARKFYTTGWLRDRIRELSYLKYNTLHLHLTDSQAFRVESDTAPEAVAPDHYSKAEITELVGYATRRHITVIPEFDLPGHASALLAHHPDLGMKGEWGLTVLDLSKPESWELAERVIQEYLPLFPAKVWHLGADEWLAVDQFAAHPQLGAAAQARYGAGADAVDLFHGFINQMNAVVKAAGKSMRIWNSALVVDSMVRVDPDISIDHWSGAGLTAQAEADAGHEVINSTSRQLYYVIDRRVPDPAKIYVEFDPNAYPVGAADVVVLNPGAPQALGAELCLWEGGKGPDEGQVAGVLDPMLRALAQVVWGSAKISDDYGTFVGISDAIGEPPGP